MTEKELADLLASNPELSADDPWIRVSPSATVQAGKRNKYNAKRTELDDMTFDSAAEAKRYSELKLLEQAGEIGSLRCQVRFPIHVNTVHVCDYVADFTYYAEGRYVVEDVKSEATKTPLYVLKRKLIEAIYRFEITEIMG